MCSRNIPHKIKSRYRHDVARIRNKKSELYTSPESVAHRGFVYLNDDVVINSLSAFEAGKVDEIVEKINLASERGASVAAGASGEGTTVSAGLGKKTTDSLQAEVIRRRTRFSVFEVWMSSLIKRKAIGVFRGWGPDALANVSPGHVVTINGRISIVPLQTGLRAYLWFESEVKAKNPLFKSIDHKTMVEPAATMRFMLGKRDEIGAILRPVGDPGPKVAMTFENQWVVEAISRWNGVFTVVAQVEEVLAAGESWQAMRIIEDAPLTPIEEKTLTDAVAPFREGLEALGVVLDENPTKVEGPALVLRPIAVFR